MKGRAVPDIVPTVGEAVPPVFGLCQPRAASASRYGAMRKSALHPSSRDARSLDVVPSGSATT